ncbi:MAG: hypothetical protein J3Q66DRAFT_364198 [Benniella sp.]|nr:MAG: hypothetical protein J3Q66DRAFT_364198 [Benniella sp.]
MVLLSAELLCISLVLLFTCHAFLGLLPLSQHHLWPMGISGLPERIKHGEGTPPDFVGKDVHVDSLSMFYGLIKIRSYRPFKKALKATNGEPLNMKSPYAPIARRIDSILSASMDKATTTLHWDGQPSVEKSAERGRRQAALDREAHRLETEISQVVASHSRSVPSRLYKMCERLFKPSQKIFAAIQEELLALNWKVCSCPFQADTHIGQICRTYSSPDEFEVVSRDCDLIAYTSIPRLTMPVGRDHHLLTFSKLDLLNDLELQSDPHLLLACILTKNDYSDGIPNVGIWKNSRIVAKILIDPGLPADEAMEAAIKEYLKEFGADHGKTLEDYKHALTAFVEFEEHGSSNATPSSQIHDRVGQFLAMLDEHKKAVHSRNPPRRTQHIPEHPQPPEPSQPPQPEAHSLKSPNTNGDRYSPHTVKDISKASKVQEVLLGNMSIAKPRAPKAQKAAAAPKNTSTTGTASTNEIKLGKDTEGDGASPLKTLYEKAFQTTTLTLGCLTGCMRRATELGDSAKDVAGCLETAADVLTTTRTITYWCLEHLVVGNLLKEAERVQEAQHELSLDPQTEASEHPQAEANPEQQAQNGSTQTVASADQQPGSPLDLLLDRQHGETVVRNLIALVLNGKIDGKGRKPTHPEATQARELAQSVYESMKKLYQDHTSQDWKPTNGTAKLPLSIPQGELAREMHTTIRTHFARLPGVIVAKMEKLGFKDIPQLKPDLQRVADGQKENPEVIIDTEDKDKAIKFDKGHIKTWWDQFQKLPSSSSTHLLPFIWLRERVRVTFRDCRDIYPLEHMKGQTSYGRTTTTMNVVTETSPETHGHDALREYLLSFYGYLRQKKQWKSEDSSSSAPPVPPPLPERPQPFDEGDQIRKYVMSNMITTDGLQLHAVAYDLRKPHQTSNARVGIQDLSKAFPDRDTIKEVFGELSKTTVVGCDPGEIVTAAFCAVDPQKPNQVQNLSIRRAALYAPVFAYRDALGRRKEEAEIDEIEQALPNRTYQSTKEFEERLAGTLESVETLRNFYGSSDMKKLNWERSKARRTEFDWATHGALSMVNDKDQGLFVMGNARFNTHQSLATLHESFKGHFYQQATRQGYHVVSTDEYCTSSKCPTCAERGRDVRVAKPTARSCRMHPLLENYVLLHKSRSLLSGLSD